MSEHRKPGSKKPGNTDSRARTDIKNDHLIFGLLGKSIVQSLPLGVIVFDSDLKIIEANSQAAELIELCEHIDKSLAKGTNLPGTPVFNWTTQLKSVVSRGKTLEFDSVNYTLNGKIRLLQILCRPLKNAKRAKILNGTIIIEDITEKVDIQRQLANAERLAAVGKLASKVAHELNNPMDGILRYINLAIRTIEQEKLEKPKEYLTQCRQGLMRMVQIVSELLEFSRRTYASLEYVQIEQIIEDAIRTMGGGAETSSIRVLRNYSRGLPQIRNGNLFQVFFNLIKNALESMPADGQLSISTRLAADNTSVVEFRDTGTGLPAEHTGVIFEPFFTTKDRGTGLGLAICKEIIEQCHGRITAENAPGGGSIFTVYLPVEGSLPEKP
ncbi:MAG TPA: PAS domain-containing protein [Planctomycetes bacterium]|nr:PAS domain-containing protein [Planctomycetota bacterium]